MPSLWLALKRAARMTATIYLIIAAATIVSYALTIGGIGVWVQEFAGLFAGNPTLFLLALMAVLLVVGTLSRARSRHRPHRAASDARHMRHGHRPMQFAMVVILTLTLGLITPPVGVCLFVACRIADSPIMPIMKAVMPFLLVEIGVVILLILVPGLSSWLPAVLH